MGDWGMGGRIANIDVSDLRKDASTGADLYDLLTDLKWKLKVDTAALGINYETGNLVQGKTVLYANRTVLSFLEMEARNHKNAELRLEEIVGRNSQKVFQLYFGEWEFKCLDSITNAEAVVS